MKHAKHTPGPWFFSTETGDWVLNTNQDVGICRVSIDPDTDEDLANAHLIAAAPELLSALKSALNDICGAIDYLRQVDDDLADELETTQDCIQCAIAKARGDS